MLKTHLCNSCSSAYTLYSVYTYKWWRAHLELISEPVRVLGLWGSMWARSPCGLLLLGIIQDFPHYSPASQWHPWQSNCIRKVALSKLMVCQNVAIFQTAKFTRFMVLVSTVVPLSKGLALLGGMWYKDITPLRTTKTTPLQRSIYTGTRGGHHWRGPQTTILWREMQRTPKDACITFLHCFIPVPRSGRWPPWRRVSVLQKTDSKNIGQTHDWMIHQNSHVSSCAAFQFPAGWRP